MSRRQPGHDHRQQRFHALVPEIACGARKVTKMVTPAPDNSSAIAMQLAKLAGKMAP
jgi:hypothetical protein